MSSSKDIPVDMQSLAVALDTNPPMVVQLKGLAPSLNEVEPLIPVTIAPQEVVENKRQHTEYEPVLSTKQQRAIDEGRNVAMFPLEWRSWPPEKVMAFMILKLSYPVYANWIERVATIGIKFSADPNAKVTPTILLNLQKAVHQSAVETYNK